MVFLWIILGIIGILALLVSLPVSLRVSFSDGEPLVQVRYLFIAYTLYPSEKEETPKGKLRQYLDGVLAELKKKRDERKKPKNGAQQPEKPKKSGWQSLREQRGFWGAIGYLIRIICESAELGAYVVRRSVISRCRLHIAIGGDDAAQIAITQGQWCAVIYPVVSLVLCSVKRYRNCSVRILPDFLSPENKYDIDIRLRVKPFHGLTGALRMLVRLSKAELSGEDRAEYSLEALKAASGSGSPDNEKE